jgi:hypothetical protein
MYYILLFLLVIFSLSFFAWANASAMAKKTRARIPVRQDR